MCECGCVLNSERFKFPGPDRSFYMLTLSGACQDCDAPSGITIELIEPGSPLFSYYSNKDCFDGPLEFHQWPDTKGTAIVCGMRKQEFIKAISAHLVSADISEMSDDGEIDEDIAEVILEEAYPDSTTCPAIVKPTK